MSTYTQELWKLRDDLYEGRISLSEVLDKLIELLIVEETTSENP